MKRTNVLIIGSVMFLAGVYVGRYYDASFVLSLFGILLTLLSRRRSRYFAVGLCVLAAALGNYRAVQRNSGFEVLRSRFELKTTVIGVSLDDAEYDSRGQLAFSVGDLNVESTSIPGRMAVSGFGATSVLRGDTVEVTGKIFESRGANQARIGFAQTANGSTRLEENSIKT
jgi:hypothetical protein